MKRSFCCIYIIRKSQIYLLRQAQQIHLFFFILHLFYHKKSNQSHATSSKLLLCCWVFIHWEQHLYLLLEKFSQDLHTFVHHFLVVQVPDSRNSVARNDGHQHSLFPLEKHSLVQTSLPFVLTSCFTAPLVWSACKVVSRWRYGAMFTCR